MRERQILTDSSVTCAFEYKWPTPGEYEFWCSAAIRSISSGGAPCQRGDSLSCSTNFRTVYRIMAWISSAEYSEASSEFSGLMLTLAVAGSHGIASVFLCSGFFCSAGTYCLPKYDPILILLFFRLAVKSLHFVRGYR